MLAFHSDKKVKQKYLKRVLDHQKADEIIKGRYWENGKGCAVGCTIHGGAHSAYERELGIPEILARLEDGIFENIPDDLAKTWPARFLKAIKPGADLSNVWAEFAVWLLTDDTYGVLQFAKSEGQRGAILAVSDLYLFKLEGADISESDWRAATTATTAATYAAYAAADAAADADAAAAATAADAAAAAAYAAYAYAYAYAYTYTYAADAADAARTKWRIAQSEKLLELLGAAR